MPNISRITDQWIGQCCCHSDPTCISMGGIIISGSPNEQSGGLAVARLTDTTIGWCGHTGIVVSGSPTTTVNSLAAARIGSSVTGCNIGTVITGNPTHDVD